MLSFFKRKAKTPEAPITERRGVLDGERDEGDFLTPEEAVRERLRQLHRSLPRGGDTRSAMDGCDTNETDGLLMDRTFLSEAVTGFFVNQGFIGHQLASLLGQHWLINKCCTMPARDAVRHWFDIRTPDGEDLNAKEVIRALSRIDKRMQLRKNCEEFVSKGRLFGIRVALFKVASTDPNYYENPFNADGITPGSYKGIVQVDPYWMAPELSLAATSDPTDLHFYEPTYWIINGKRYHRSHLVIFRNAEPSDLLKPAYLYGGIPVPQLIVERVYAAERTANEAPQLAMTKRTTFLKMDLTKAFAKGRELFRTLSRWVKMRDNYGVKVMGLDDELGQFDTSLADLDAVIMTNYQLVAAAAHVPATKLMGTTPKGFNATGEYEEASYHEELESIQSGDLTDLIERHHLIAMRSDVAPALRIAPIETSISWAPLDSPTAKEYAEIQLTKAQTDFQLVQAGAIDGYDVRARVIADKDSDYLGMADAQRPDEADEDGEAGVTPGALGAATGTDGADDVLLISNQEYLDPRIVQFKREAGDYVVQVSPIMIDAPSGRRVRIVMDGHHSLAAANADGVSPVLQESPLIVGDYSPL